MDSSQCNILHHPKILVYTKLTILHTNGLFHPPIYTFKNFGCYFKLLNAEQRKLFSNVQGSILVLSNGLFSALY